MQRTIRENPGEIRIIGESVLWEISDVFSCLIRNYLDLLKGIYLMCGRFRAFDFQDGFKNTVVKKMVLPTTGGAREWNAFMIFMPQKPFMTANLLFIVPLV
ncbi:MAG: hypothetical protein ACLU77_13365 [Waltera sp.]